jgi:hypothetical protein
MVCHVERKVSVTLRAPCGPTGAAQEVVAVKQGKDGALPSAQDTLAPLPPLTLAHTSRRGRGVSAGRGITPCGKDRQLAQLLSSFSPPSSRPAARERCGQTESSAHSPVTDRPTHKLRAGLAHSRNLLCLDYPTGSAIFFSRESMEKVCDTIVAWRRTEVWSIPVMCVLALVTSACHAQNRTQH